MSDSAPSLTMFQRTAEDSISRVLAQHGRTIDSRAILHGVVPFYSGEPLTVVKLESDDFEAWLYDDEASFSARGGGGAVERLNFRTEADVLAALMKQIEAALSR